MRSAWTEDETFEKWSILFKFKEGENFNHRNTGVFRGLKFEPNAEIEQKGAFCKCLKIIRRKTCQNIPREK